MNEWLKEIRDRDNSGLIKAAILLTYWAAIIFAEIMFITIMAVVFPTGLIRDFAIAGAVANGVTACLMPFAKDHYFAPGKMHTIGLILWAADVAVLFLNVLLAFETNQGITTGGMFSWWYDFSPASPLMAVVTWGVLMVLSPEHEAHQKNMLRKTRLADAYAEQEFEYIEAGGVDDIFQAGARANVRDMAEHIARRKIRVPAQRAANPNGHKNEKVVLNAETVTTDLEARNPKNA